MSFIKYLLIITFLFFSSLVVKAQLKLPELPIFNTKNITTKNIDSLLLKSTQKIDKNSIVSLSYLFYANKLTTTNLEKTNIAKQASTLSSKLYKNAKYKEAVYFQSLTGSIWLELDSITNYTTSIRNLGFYYFRLGDIYNTIKYLNVALALSKKNNQKWSEYLCLYELAWANWRIGNCDEAINYIELSKIIIDEGTAKDKKAFYYNSISSFYKCKGDLTQAIIEVNKAIEISKKRKFKRLYGVATTNKAQYLIDTKGNPKEIIAMIIEVLEINKEMNDMEQLGSNYGLLAKAYNYDNQYNKAIKISLKGKKICEEIGVLPRVLESYNFLKEAYTKKKDFTNALKYSEKYNVLYKELYGTKNIKKIFELQKENAKELSNNIIQNLKITNKQNKRIYWLASIIVLLLFSGMLLYFIQSKKNQKLKNEALKKQLTHELLQMEMEALRSRMNPHFIFNSLNSIKSFIISNDVKNSVSYFSKFAKLLRYSLNNSSIDFVNLEDEITFLSDYVILENLRLTHSFEFIIEVSDNLDLKSLQIPPLIMQPFIENAIWHGLSLKKDNGKLILKIISKNDFLEIHIIDNGIGRKASKIINKNKTHSSKGISITTKRLAIFSKIYKLKKSFEIIDLNDENGKAEGTKVIIKLPRILKNDAIIKSKLLV